MKSATLSTAQLTSPQTPVTAPTLGWLGLRRLPSLRWAWAAVVPLLLAVAQPARADTIPLAPGFGEPISRSGAAGGPVNSGDCGAIAGAPNHVLAISQDFGSLRVRVSGGEGLTLLVVGPGGRFCVPASGGTAEMPGYWSAGSYQIFVGNRAGAGGGYSLSIATR